MLNDIAVAAHVAMRDFDVERILVVVGGGGDFSLGALTKSTCLE